MQLCAHESTENPSWRSSAGDAASNGAGSTHTEPGRDRVVPLRPAITRDNESPSKNVFIQTSLTDEHRRRRVPLLLENTFPSAGAQSRRAESMQRSFRSSMPFLLDPCVL